MVTQKTPSSSILLQQIAILFLEIYTIKWNIPYFLNVKVCRIYQSRLECDPCGQMPWLKEWPKQGALEEGIKET